MPVPCGNGLYAKSKVAVKNNLKIFNEYSHYAIFPNGIMVSGYVLPVLFILEGTTLL